jgi:hypothetical protein
MFFERHIVNGVLVGRWYHMDDGRVVYLAQRTPRSAHRRRAAWGFELALLKMCLDKKVSAIGVAVSRKKPVFYLTRVEDFFGDHSFWEWGDRGRVRFLPMGRWRVSPHRKTGKIEQEVRLR